MTEYHFKKEVEIKLKVFFSQSYKPCSRNLKLKCFFLIKFSNLAHFLLSTFNFISFQIFISLIWLFSPTFFEFKWLTGCVANQTQSQILDFRALWNIFGGSFSPSFGLMNVFMVENGPPIHVQIVVQRVGPSTLPMKCSHPAQQCVFWLLHQLLPFSMLLGHRQNLV